MCLSSLLVRLRSATSYLWYFTFAIHSDELGRWHQVVVLNRERLGFDDNLCLCVFSRFFGEEEVFMTGVERHRSQPLGEKRI